MENGCTFDIPSFIEEGQSETDSPYDNSSDEKDITYIPVDDERSESGNLPTSV